MSCHDSLILFIRDSSVIVTLSLCLRYEIFYTSTNLAVTFPCFDASKLGNANGCARKHAKAIFLNGRPELRFRLTCLLLRLLRVIRRDAYVRASHCGISARYETVSDNPDDSYWSRTDWLLNAIMDFKRNQGYTTNLYLVTWLLGNSYSHARIFLTIAN